jgi:hypothetical protein
MRRREPRHVAGDLARDMRATDAEMVEQRDKPVDKRRLTAHATTPAARNSAISVSP